MGPGTIMGLNGGVYSEYKSKWGMAISELLTWNCQLFNHLSIFGTTLLTRFHHFPIRVLECFQKSIAQVTQQPFNVAQSSMSVVHFIRE